MADKFDPYRERLVMEIDTVWPEELGHLSPAQKIKIEEQLHADPEKCHSLAYVRVHTGFCRQITVTQDDVNRVAG